MTYRIGVELELLAPAGKTRADLAERLAEELDGRVVRGWHLDSEPSAHPDIEVFRHLTPAFDVVDGAGEQVVRIVDDVTIKADLDKKVPSPDGWTRVLSDDARILRMLTPRLPDVVEDFDQVASIAAEFGLGCEDKGGAYRFHDDSDASVALVTGVPGEKSRVAECISPPLASGVADWLQLVAGSAASLGFTVPTEGATHLHYDADLFRDPHVFQRVVWAFGEDHEPIRERFATNPDCTRLGALPPSLVELVSSDGYAELSWDEVVEKSRALGEVTKYADVNLLHLITDKPRIQTVEFRMLPSTLDVAQLLDMRNNVDQLVDHFLATT